MSLKTRPARHKYFSVKTFNPFHLNMKLIVKCLFQITLRVKESEVQCLKQELTSLKDELQSAQKVRRTLI